MRTDPFTVEIIGDVLRASSEEMFVTLGRTAQSPIIYEVLDMACGLITPQGELIAEAAGVPGVVHATNVTQIGTARRFHGMQAV